MCAGYGLWVLTASAARSAALLASGACSLSYNTHRLRLACLLIACVADLAVEILHEHAVEHGAAARGRPVVEVREDLPLLLARVGRHHEHRALLAAAAATAARGAASGAASGAVAVEDLLEGRKQAQGQRASDTLARVRVGLPPVDLRPRARVKGALRAREKVNGEARGGAREGCVKGA